MRTGSELRLRRALRLDCAGFEQRVLALHGIGVEAFLDVAITTNVLGNRGDIHGKGVVFVVQTAQQLVDLLEVAGNELAFHLALFGVAEYIEWAAAQALEAGQHAEGLEHPRPVFRLAQLTLRILLRQQGWGQMEMDPEVALEGLANAPFEIAAGIEAGDFVLVLVGHQLEGITRDGLAQIVEARRAFLLDLAHLVDQRPIALRVSRVLILGKKLHAAGDLLVERCAQGQVIKGIGRMCRCRRGRTLIRPLGSYSRGEKGIRRAAHGQVQGNRAIRQGRRGQPCGASHQGGIVCAHAAPVERLLVHLDGRTIELDRLH